MLSLKKLSIVFAAALITFGASAQASATQDSKTKTNAPVMKDKTVTKTKPSGKTKTVTTSKPSSKSVKADSSSHK